MVISAELNPPITLLPIFNTYFLMEAYNRKWALRPQFHTHEGSGILQATFFQPLCEWRHQLKNIAQINEIWNRNNLADRIYEYE